VPLDCEYPSVDRRRWSESGRRHPGARHGDEVPLPPVGPWRVVARPSASGLVLKDEIRAYQPAARLQEALEERGGDSERRIGYHLVGAPRKSEVRSVGLDDDNVRPKSLSKVAESVRVGFDGDHPSACLEEDSCDRPMPCPYIEDQAAGTDAGVSDEARRPSRVELVPSPPPWRDHGPGPS
jgi:hypothetical protein